MNYLLNNEIENIFKKKTTVSEYNKYNVNLKVDKFDIAVSALDKYYVKLKLPKTAVFKSINSDIKFLIPVPTKETIDDYDLNVVHKYKEILFKWVI